MNLADLALVVVAVIYLAAFLVFFVTSEINRKRIEKLRNEMDS